MEESESDHGMRCFRLDSPCVPDDRLASVSCHKAQHRECQLLADNSQSSNIADFPLMGRGRQSGSQ